MLNQLESSYNCANASNDLHQLKFELDAYLTQHWEANSKETHELLNRPENQIRFIRNKCDIH